MHRGVECAFWGALGKFRVNRAFSTRNTGRLAK